MSGAAMTELPIDPVDRVVLAARAKFDAKDALIKELVEALEATVSMINEMGPRISFSGGEADMFAMRAGQVRDAGNAALAKARQEQGQ